MHRAAGTASIGAEDLVEAATVPMLQVKSGRRLMQGNRSWDDGGDDLGGLSTGDADC
jgi:hypothetical protein